MKKYRFIAVLLIALLAVFSLSAEGARERSVGETLVRVLSIEESDDGYRINALREDGTEVIYNVGPDSNVTYTLDAVNEGDYLIIQDNGISTMSIPPQFYAESVRYVTPAVLNGIINGDFFTPQRHSGLILDITEIDEEDLISKFSFAYGYLSAISLRQSSLYPYAGYFARGIIDAGTTDATPLIDIDTMNTSMNEYIQEYISNGIITDHGPVISTLDEILMLESPEDLVERFAYAYGYMSYINLIYSGIDIYPEEFAYGTLTAFYGSTSPYTEEEMNAIIEEYIVQLQEDYAQWLAELAENNLGQAEAFLADNANREDVITLDSGLQLEFTYKDPDGGAMPTATDTVNVDYTLTLMDGSVMDRGEGIEFALSSLIPGFTEAVENMNVGDSVRAYIHPSLGYGESGTATIEPNSLLIFDITLNSIV